MFKRTLQSSVVVRLRSVGDRDGRVSLYFTHNPTILREGRREAKLTPFGNLKNMKKMFCLPSYI